MTRVKACRVFKVFELDSLPSTYPQMLHVDLPIHQPPGEPQLPRPFPGYGSSVAGLMVHVFIWNALAVKPFEFRHTTRNGPCIMDFGA